MREATPMVPQNVVPCELAGAFARNGGVVANPDSNTRAHLVTYHGVLAPASALRAAIVPRPAATAAAHRSAGAGHHPGGVGQREGSPPSRACGRHPWAELLKRVFAVDALRCPGCGGRRTILAAITQGEVIRAILAALHLPTEPPAVHPARGPPGLFSEA